MNQTLSDKRGILMRGLKHIRFFKFIITVVLFTILSTASAFGDTETPGEEYLAQTMECQWALTQDPENPGNYINDPEDELVALAAALDNDPVKIYNWVYENIYYAKLLSDNSKYYYNHSRLGARGAYLKRIGNTWDQSSLLIALLRISGIPARYVRPHTTNDHVYVEAWVDLDNYYGVAQGSQQGWVPLVPWLKKFNLVEGEDLFPLSQDGSTAGQLDPDPDSDLNFNFNNYLSKIKYESALEEYEKKLQNYLKVNYSGKSLKDIPFEEIFIKNTGSILPRSFPVDLARNTKITFSSVSNNDREYVDLSIDKSSGGNLLTYRVYLPEIAGKRFCLDWKISGSTMKPVFKLNDEEIYGGGPSKPSINAGENFYLTFQVRGNPGKKRPDRVAGTFIQMGFDPLAASAITIEKMKQELQSVDLNLALNPNTHEKYLGLTGGILVETYLLRLYENAERTADLLYGKINWGLAPTFVFAKPHFIDPFQTAPESKFYYHPKWNIDQQTYSGFYKWDKSRQTISSTNSTWNDPLNELSRRLYMFGASYDEGKIFEDWMDTPGSSTVRGIMVVNEEAGQGTSTNFVTTLTEADIIENTQAITLDFEAVPASGEYNEVDSVYSGFDWSGIARIDSTTQCAGIANGAVNGTYGIYCSSGIILRGTKFSLASVRLTSANNTSNTVTFRLYKDGASSPFSSGSITVNATPRVVSLNFPAANRIYITANNGPVIIDDFTFTRNEYIQALDDQTEGHLGYSTILSIVNDLHNGAEVVVPVQEVEYEGLSGHVRIVYGEEGYGDRYAFGMYNGGGASPQVKQDITYTDSSTISTDTGSVSAATQNDWKDKYTTVDNGAEKAIIKPQETFNAAKPSLGDPVDMVTGEFYTEETPDFQIKGRGLDLSIARKYKSKTIYNGPFGYGWTWNHGERILPLTGGDVLYYDNDGDAQEINSNGDGTYTYPKGSQFVLTMESGEYVITRNRTRLRSFFSGQGYLIRKADRFGNTLTFEYNNAGHPEQLTHIKDNLLVNGQPRSLELTYNSSGKVTSVTDFEGRTCSYHYLGDDLIEFRGLDYQASLGNATRYEYLAGQANEFLNHNMTKYTLPGGDYLEIGYYKNDQAAYHRNAKGETFNFMYSRLNRYAETLERRGVLP